MTYQHHKPGISQLNRWERIETKTPKLTKCRLIVSPSLTAGSGLKLYGYAVRGFRERISQLNRWERIETLLKRK